MEYIKVTKAAERWGISTRRARVLCAEGKIPGVIRKGNLYLIPSNASKPLDGRKTRAGMLAEIEAKREPFVLFASNDVPYSAAAVTPTSYHGKRLMRYGSDAPFVRKLKNGKLFLTWSPIPANNYVVLGAVADNIRGPWKHIDKPLFDDNGGHAMLFTDFDGTVKMCFHQPEKPQLERAKIITLVEYDEGFLPK